MLVTLISQIAVDLVRDYQYVVLQAQLTDPLQLFKGEAAHSGVVGVGHKEQLGAGILQLLLQIVKINLIFAVFVLHKAVLQQLAAVVAYDSGEGRVNRGLNDHLVAGIRIGSDGVHQERKNTVGVLDPVRIHVPAKVDALPARCRLFKLKGLNGIAEAGVLCPLLDGLGNFCRYGKVRIRDPHREHVLWIAGSLVLLALGDSPVDDLVKIVSHSISPQKTE